MKFLRGFNVADGATALGIDKPNTTQTSLFKGEKKT